VFGGVFWTSKKKSQIVLAIATHVSADFRNFLQGTEGLFWHIYPATGLSSTVLHAMLAPLYGPPAMGIHPQW